MRTHTAVAGLVVVAVAGSIGIVFAQKGLPWPAGTGSQAAPAVSPAAAAPAVAAPAPTVAAEPRQVVRPVA
ncbi:hypothetical protein PQJ75_17760, partial [Rhodoplanes sp. TEM]|nr:hypothetical protein [Rhodoplanes sp. TEM]